MELTTLKVNDNKNIREIILNRPNSLNSINYDVLSELEFVIDDSKFNDDVRAIIIKGSGRAFCAGDDLKGMGTEKTPFPYDNQIKRVELMYSRIIISLRKLLKPVIAQVHGYALGAGCDLALACDLIFAEKDTQFGLVFIKRGLTGGTALLPKTIGYHKACELLFSGDMFSANFAKEMGIVNFIGTKKEIEYKVTEWAEKLSHSPTTAIGLMKNALNQDLELERAINIQKYVSQSVYYTLDKEEGSKAFFEKREPNFKGK